MNSNNNNNSIILKNLSFLSLRQRDPVELKTSEEIIHKLSYIIQCAMPASFPNTRF